jgi:hypothetical protein
MWENQEIDIYLYVHCLDKSLLMKNSYKTHKKEYNVMHFSMIIYKVLPLNLANL